jgi:hypothetical protein
MIPAGVSGQYHTSNVGKQIYVFMLTIQPEDLQWAATPSCRSFRPEIAGTRMSIFAHPGKATRIVGHVVCGPCFPAGTMGHVVALSMVLLAYADG